MDLTEDDHDVDIQIRGLLSGDEVDGVRQCVVGDRVSQMVAQILQRSLASDNRLHEEGEHGEHGETAVLDLLHLQVRERVGIVS